MVPVCLHFSVEYQLEPFWRAPNEMVKLLPLISRSICPINFRFFLNVLFYSGKGLKLKCNFLWEILSKTNALQYNKIVGKKEKKQKSPAAPCPYTWSGPY